MKSVGLRKMIKKNKNRTLGICAGLSVLCFVLFFFPSVPKNTAEERARAGSQPLPPCLNSEQLNGSGTLKL